MIFFAKAEKANEALGADDWLEAFTSHPAIGSLPPLRAQHGNQRSALWAHDEQSGINKSTFTILSELEEKNKQYSDKFGFVFLICATGKSGFEMLEDLKKRIPHSRNEELKIAAREQQKITRLRLEKLLK